MDRRPQTLCRLTAAGRERLLAYVAELEKVVAMRCGPSSKRPRPRHGCGRWRVGLRPNAGGLFFALDVLQCKVVGGGK